MKAFLFVLFFAGLFCVNSTPICAPYDTTSSFWAIEGGSVEFEQPNLVPTSSHTFMFWYQMRSDQDINKIPRDMHLMIAGNSGCSNEISLALFKDPATLLNHFAVEDCNGIEIYTQEVVPLDQWIHLAETWDETTNTVSLYMNGSLALQGTYHFEIISNCFTMGRRCVTSDYGLGLFDDFKMFNLALSQSEVEHEMVVPGSPATVGLVGYWDGTLVGTQLKDQILGNFGDFSGSAQLVPCIPAVATPCTAVSFRNEGFQIRADNQLSSSVTIEGRYELLTDSNHAYENWLNKESINGNAVTLTRLKQRVISVIEFIDTGVSGYRPGEDTIVQSKDFSQLHDSWQQWSMSGPSQFTSHSTLNIFKVDLSVQKDSPCPQESAAHVRLGVDFTSKYIRSDSKLALVVRYETFEDVTVNGHSTSTIFAGDQSANIFSHFGPVSQANSGAVNILSYYTSTGSDDKPQYLFYLTFDTTAHIPFNDILLV